MKNLTGREVQVRNKNGTTDRYPASATVPCITGGFIATKIHVKDALPVLIVSRVNFGGLVLNHSEGPFIVVPEILKELDMQQGHFVTPDLGPTAIRNTFGGVHAITQFISKPETSHSDLPLFANLQSIKN